MECCDGQEYGKPHNTLLPSPLFTISWLSNTTFTHPSLPDSVLIHLSPLLSHCTCHVMVMHKSLPPLSPHHSPYNSITIFHLPCHGPCNTTTSASFVYHILASCPKVCHVTATHAMYGTSASPFNITHCQRSSVCQKAQDVKAVAGKSMRWVWPCGVLDPSHESTTTRDSQGHLLLAMEISCLASPLSP